MNDMYADSFTDPVELIRTVSMGMSATRWLWKTLQTSLVRHR